MKETNKMALLKIGDGENENDKLMKLCNLKLKAVPFAGKNNNELFKNVTPFTIKTNSPYRRHFKENSNSTL